MIYRTPPENHVKTATLVMTALSAAGASSFLAVTDATMTIIWLNHPNGDYPNTP